MSRWFPVVLFAFLLGCTGTYQLPGKTKEGTAQNQAKMIELALIAYHEDHGHYPDAGNLKVLTQRLADGGPYLSADGLVDPWGKPFQVDFSGATYHKGSKPDVFTTTPTGKVVGNFKTPK
jgi:type II secretory pathway pseudopilin PulG